MLNPSPSYLPKICTIADDVEAVIRLAEYLSHIDEEFLRYDYSFSDASTALQSPELEDVVTVIIAPSLSSAEKHVLLIEVIDQAIALGAICILLLPKSLPFLEKLKLKGVEIVSGPPFVPIKGITQKNPDQVHTLSKSSAATKDGSSASRWDLSLSRFFRLGREDDASKNKSKETVSDLGKIQVIAFQGTAGGVGTTTIAASFAVELADRFQDKSVCLLDLNVQFGNTAELLDVKSNSKITDAFRNISRLDIDAFKSLLFEYSDNLSVFSAPPEVMPLDVLNDDGVEKLIELARSAFACVIIDLPSSIPDWYGKMIVECDELILVSVADVRCAYNARKLLDLLQSEKLPDSKCRFVLNKTPKRPDKSWLSHRESFELGIGKKFSHSFGYGGDEITELGNAGLSLKHAHDNNPFKKSVSEFGASYVDRVEQEFVEGV